MILEELKSLRTQRLILSLACIFLSLSILISSLHSPVIYISSKEGFYEATKIDKTTEREFFIKTFINERFNNGALQQFLSPELILKPLSSNYRILKTTDLGSNEFEIELILSNKNAVINLKLEEKLVSSTQPFRFQIISYEDRFQ